MSVSRANVFKLKKLYVSLFQELTVWPVFGKCGLWIEMGKQGDVDRKYP